MFFLFLEQWCRLIYLAFMISCDQDYKEWWRRSQWESVRMVMFTVSDWCPFCSKKSTIPSEFWYVIGFLCCLFSFLLHAVLGDVSSHVKISQMWWLHTPWILVHLWSFFGWMTSEWILSLSRFEVYSSAGFTRSWGRVWGMEPADAWNDFFWFVFCLGGYVLWILFGVLKIMGCVDIESFDIQ